MKNKIIIFLQLFMAAFIFMLNFTGKSTNSLAQGESINIENTMLYSGCSRIFYENLKTFKEKRTTIEEKKLDELDSGWTTSNLNIRKEPTKDSDVIGTLPFNIYIQFYQYNDEWVKVEYESITGFISSDYISHKENDYEIYPVPLNDGFKSYMPYTAITAKTSKQYVLQAQYAYTGNFGIRMISGRYCVAIGTAFHAKIGDYADLILENGETLPVVVSDIKSDKDTEENCIVTASNGCVSEFIIDKRLLDSNAKVMGDISYCTEIWDSPVAYIRIYEKNVLD